MRSENTIGNLELPERLEKSFNSWTHRGGHCDCCPCDPNRTNLPVGFPGVGGGVQHYPNESCKAVSREDRVEDVLNPGKPKKEHIKDKQ